jgi:hypothetical protein
MSKNIDTHTVDQSGLILGEAFQRSIAFRPIFADLFGKDLTIGMYLSQAYYWCCGKDGKSRGSLADGWIYKTCDHFKLETYLSRRQQEKARAALRAKSWWSEKVSRIGGVPKLHFRIDLKLLVAEIVQFKSAKTTQDNQPQKNTNNQADRSPNQLEPSHSHDLYAPYISEKTDLTLAVDQNSANQLEPSRSHDLYAPYISEKAYLSFSFNDQLEHSHSHYFAKLASIGDRLEPSHSHDLYATYISDLYDPYIHTENTQHRFTSISNILPTCHTDTDKDNTEVSFLNDLELELEDPKIHSLGANQDRGTNQEMTDLNLTDTTDRATCRTSVNNTTTNTRPKPKREDPNFGGSREFKLQVNWGIDNDLWRTKEEYTAFKVAAITYLPSDPVNGWRKDPAQHLIYQIKRAMSKEDDAKAFILELWNKYSPDEGIVPLRASWLSLDERKQRMYQRWINEDTYWQWQRGNIPGWTDKVLNQPNSKFCTEAWDIWVAWQQEEEDYYAKLIADELALQAETARLAAIPPMTEPEKAALLQQSAEFTAKMKLLCAEQTAKQQADYEASKPTQTEFDRLLAANELANYQRVCIEQGWDVPTEL